MSSQDRLTSLFGQSIKNWARTLDSRSHESVINSFSDLDEQLEVVSGSELRLDVQEAFKLALHSVAHTQTTNAEIRVGGAIGTCGSPIEAILLLALVTYCSQCGCNLQLVRPGSGGELENIELDILGDGTPKLKVVQQAEIAEYRVDFLLEYDNWRGRKAFTRDEHDQDFDFIVDTVASHVIVECDGHDFHEKTKE